MDTNETASSELEQKYNSADSIPEEDEDNPDEKSDSSPNGASSPCPNAALAISASEVTLRELDAAPR